MVRCLLDAGEAVNEQAIYAILRLAQGSAVQLQRDPQMARASRPSLGTLFQTAEALALGLAALKPVASEPSRAASSDLVELALAQGKARRLDFFTCPARWMRCSTAWRSWARGICRRTTPPACASARADVRQPTARC